jgi:hypothetical protein
MCSGCYSSNPPPSWLLRSDPRGVGVSDLQESGIWRFRWESDEFLLQLLKGLTSDMDGFSCISSHSSAGKIHLRLVDHTVTVSIPKLISAINGGMTDPVVGNVFEAWCHDTFRRLLARCGLGTRYVLRTRNTVYGLLSEHGRPRKAKGKRQLNFTVYGLRIKRGVDIPVQVG